VEDVVVDYEVFTKESQFILHVLEEASYYLDGSMDEINRGK
jgi:hypothetical protein